MLRMETREGGDVSSEGDLKKAVRLRMTQTGEKYTTALRALQGDPEELKRMKDQVKKLRLVRKEAGA
jgi:hypothetical protein